MLMKSMNPATGEIVWEGKSASQQEVNQAVTKARTACSSWSVMSIEARKEMIKRFAAHLTEHKQDFAELISQEVGKPLWESLLEVGAMINKADISFRAQEERCPVAQNKAGDIVKQVEFRPQGVVAVLGPFNLPGHLPNGHIIPALLAGNAVVFKPSEQAPLIGEKYLEYWKAAGLPEGVMEVVQGGKETGEALVQHAAIKGLFFTGSYAVGQGIHKLLGGHPEKILVLEMGGNNPLIVDEVADLEAAAYMTIQSAFITSGQRCVCARRLIVLKGAQGDAFIQVLVAMTRKVKVGAFNEDPEPFMGPVISKEAAERILEEQKRLVQKGGRILLEMKCVGGSPAMLSPGIMESTTIKDREDGEIFGPLLQVIRVENIEEAMTEANRTEYGLAAGIFSDNVETCQRFVAWVRAGIVNWNRPLTGASSEAPFGGIGRSGNHRPSAYFAADYCAYPVASMGADVLKIPEKMVPGIQIY